MGYLHIENLYKNQTILLFRECYALEKIHGTSAHVAWKDGELRFFSGGENHSRFCGLFDAENLAAVFRDMGHPVVTVYGEAYGGKQQGQSWRYGTVLRFTAFDVKVGDTWLCVPHAESVVKRLDLDFVAYVKVSTELPEIHAERDAPSIAAGLAGVEGIQPREGVVLRPLVECTLSNGSRVICKHKRDAERETKSVRLVDADKQVILEAADKIADEWVTTTRLQHVLAKMPYAAYEQIPDVIAAMQEDVLWEAAGEIVDSKDARRAIGRRTVQLFKQHLKEALV